VRGQELNALVRLIISHVRVLETDDQRLDGIEVNGSDYLVIVSFRVDLKQITSVEAVLLQQARNRYATDLQPQDLVGRYSMLN